MKKVIRSIVLFLIIIIIICLLAHFMYVYKYNTCVQDVQERYSYLYDDLQNVIENKKIPFEELNTEFAFFLTAYAEWELLYRETYNVNMIPNIHEESGLTPEDLVDTYRNLRDLYYECVQLVYFNEKIVTEDLSLKLEVVNNNFNIFFVKLAYLS